MLRAATLSPARAAVTLLLAGWGALTAHGAERDDAELPRLRVVQGASDRPGTSAWLVAHDPWLAWGRGRDLFRRSFSARDGAGEPLAVPRLADGRTAALRLGPVTSCALCHERAGGDGGSGPVIPKNGPSGRRTPHLRGAGLIEQLAGGIRSALLATVDRDGDGMVSAAEAAGVRAIVATGVGAQVSYGRFDDADGDGRPDLDPQLHVWYLDLDHHRVPGARRLDDPGVAGFDFALQAFGWGETPGVAHGLSLRSLVVGAFMIHAGIQAEDPALAAEPRHDGWAATPPSGAAQVHLGTPADCGLRRDAGGFSLDDPDGDGVCAELTAGDLDLIEHYLLNLPAPAERRAQPGVEAGRAHFAALGCAACHVPDWELRGRDRRFAALTVAEDSAGALVAQLESPTCGGTLRVAGLYSDLASHDLGPAFHQVQFDGSVVTRFRTPPLWGVGSCAPYGHDGASLDLDAVIRRHGGEAADSAARYRCAPIAQRQEVLAFLGALVLYGLDGLPCRGADGDGAFAAPRWFAHPPGPGVPAAQAWGAALQWLRDADGDGFPDACYAQ